MRVVAILQARMSSTRLPGKVMLELEGDTCLMQQVKRIQHAKKIDQLVIATSTDISDDIIYDSCIKEGLSCFRGSLTDVLDRYFQAATQYQATEVVRLTADCPLTSPALIDKIITRHIETQSDYTTNCLPYTFPDGLDVEVVKFDILQHLHQTAVTQDEREHVCFAIRNQPDKYTIHNLTRKDDISHLRWTLDYWQDLQFVRQIYRHLYKKNEFFDIDEILQLLKSHPELLAINKKYVATN